MLREVMVAPLRLGLTVLVMGAGCAMVLGSTGVHARSLRVKERRAFAVWLLVASAALLVPLLVFFAGVRGVPLLVVVGLGLVVASASWGLADRARVRVRQLAAGIRAEELTASRLERLPVTAVVHDVLLSNGDVDHVVLGPVCAAVETKYGQGSVVISGGKVQVGRRILRGDPISQARRSADLVARVIGVPCLPLLVISGASGPPQLHAGVWVLSPDHLPNVIGSLPQVVDPVTARNAAVRLHEKTQQRSGR